MSGEYTLSSYQTVLLEIEDRWLKIGIRLIETRQVKIKILRLVELRYSIRNVEFSISKLIRAFE